MLLAVTGLAACTQDDPEPIGPQALVVSTSAPFQSLNGALVEGSSQGSRLVRGAVQERLTRWDTAGELVTNTDLGTVEKISDAPLTVRYTLADDAVWSDGVPITPDDLVLEWAARSGRFDEVGAEPAPDATDPAGASPSPGPSATPGATVAPAGDVVRFGATSSALVHAEAFPVVDGRTVTLVYDTPVADWPTALDLGLPAHVVGRLALGDPTAPSTPSPDASGDTVTGGPTSSESPVPSGNGSPSASPTAPGGASDWAAAVRTALQTDDRVALAAVADVWRTGFGGDQLAADPSRAVTSGPYAIASVVEGEQVELVRNDRYAGAAAAAYDRVVVRTDVDQLAQVDALADGDVDVIATVAQQDLVEALADVEGAGVTTGGGRVLQLVTQVAGGGAFDPASSGGDAARAQAVRRAFLAAVPREQLAADLRTLDPDAQVSDAVLPALGAQSSSAAAAPVAAAAPSATAAASQSPITVRLLVVAGAPQQDAFVRQLVQAAGTAGFDVQLVEVDDPATTAWQEPTAWDVALVPVAQSDTPVSTVVDAWHTGER
ncbi:ABC transporter substrate-binding protein [Cellulomonas soli]